ncbi:helix-turn-helix transcriptional regulator [Fulvivirga sp. 29W222]|uniref:Helix-turn-helix transcriptional regulator n=1 Tax=Fulvivirga marina TaxID=2494733 RepID=A0A937KEZ8_9BACT|nr:helix-turn-helix domain-containing protein [Fulvivirga marina]MBL6447678.1 helix-turn-helix transcriptional regulator [Fulvivirga marina]
MEKIVHHKISDLYKTLSLPFEQELDFTILSIPDIHPQIPFKSPILQADYFSFILTKDGSGVYYLDDNRFPFGSGTVYFTNPGHIKSYELNESNDAYIITLTENFLRENVHSEIYSEFPFLLAEIVPPQKLSQTDFEEFDILYKQIETEFKKDSKYKNKILGHMFLVFLLKIKEKFWLDYDAIEEGNRNSQIVRSFKQILEAEFRNVMEKKQNNDKLQVQDFAKRLNLHPNYLNSVIKSKTGRTVNDWISKRTLAVSKNLLISTSCSSKEIAYKLGFSEPTHFSRFFKKHTQLSPGAYRKSNKL